MCDTDDTDDLLLIPPDFFVIDSDSGHSNIVEPYYNIVDGLIQQVSNLQNRIKSIESISLNTSDSYFVHTNDMQNSSSGFRKYNSTDDLYIPPNTHQKPLGKFKINSLPASPNLERFSPRRSPKVNREFQSPTRANMAPKTTKKSPLNDGQMLNEIDTFLSKVKIIQRSNAARNLEKEFDNGDISKKDKNSKEIHQLLADFDRQQQKIGLESSEVNNRLENDLVKEPTIVQEKTWRQGDNKESVPDYGSGVIETLYPNYKEANKPKSDYMKQTNPINEQSTATNDSWISLDKYPSTDSSSDSQLTAYNKYKKDRNDLLNSPLHSNALNVLNMHKQLLENGAKQTNTKSKVRERKSREMTSVNDNLGLLSLADIWNKKSHSHPSQFLPKLQEEKLRRQHCEELIQELQNHNLELQQRLSVAVKVDDSKNITIRQFQEALEKIIVRLEKFNNEKQGLEQEVMRLKTKHSEELEEASQKVAYYEKEASKALNLAHGNQEKLSSLERRSLDLQHELQLIEQKCKGLHEDYSREVEKNKQLSNSLNQKEMELLENKDILNNARGEVAQSKNAVEVCQAEFTSMKSQYAKLQNELKEEKSQVILLKEQKKVLLNEMETHKQHEKELKEELDRIKKQLESNKIELRNYYQGQVEILVQNKLTEFQGQLDKAESAFKDQTKKREMSIAKTAATHIQQISEKCSLEIKLLEKKHQEEMKLSQIQLIQYKQQVDVLQSKLDQMQEKRVHLAKQLQKIMEAQWAEALRIITSGKSPTFNDEAFRTIDQLNSLKTKSYNNVEEVLAQQHEEHHLVRKKNEAHFSMPTEETSSINSSYEKTLQEVCKMPVDTPVSSRSQGSKQYNENDIQKYINLLLSRPPGNPTHEVQQRESGKTSPENVSDRAYWQNVRSRRTK